MREIFFVLKDGNGEIFDEIFDKYIGWWKWMVKKPAKTKSHRFDSRMLEYELDGTWHLGSLKKKHIWKPISRENLEFLGFSSLVWNPPRGSTKPTVEFQQIGVRGGWVDVLNTEDIMETFFNDRSEVFEDPNFWKSFDWCLLSFNRHIPKKRTWGGKVLKWLNPFGIQRILWSFQMMVDASKGSFWHKIHGGTTGRLFGVKKRTLQEIVAVDSKCLDSLEEAYRQGPFHIEHE